MELTQEGILSSLTAAGGRIPNSELLLKYRELLNCPDPADKKLNRDLFKSFINNVAVVKEIDGIKNVVLKKSFLHLLHNSSPEEPQTPRTGQEEGEREEEQNAPSDEEQNKPEQEHPTETSETAFRSQAFQRHQSVNYKNRRSMHFVVPLPTRPETHAHKPYALPLRAPPVVITTPAPENRKNDGDSERLPNDDPTKLRLEAKGAVSGPPSSPMYKRRSLADGMTIPSSPQIRRHPKSTKPSADEPRYSDGIPMEAAEHRWLVTSAAGQWMSVYGLLLSDAHLAQKKDFISGFTALHWAAKCGNSEMVCKLIELSRQTGKGLDVNTKSYAGYTPLHIAAIHRREYIMGLLVRDYNANCHIRDNAGKKAHHYLQAGISPELRELLGGSKVVPPEPAQKTAEEAETHKHVHSISRLFQPQSVGYRKKQKYRSTILSVPEETRGDREEHGAGMHRVKSDLFS